MAANTHIQDVWQPSFSRERLNAVALLLSVAAGCLIAFQSVMGLGAVVAFFAASFLVMRPLYGLMSILWVVNIVFVIDRGQRIGFTLPVTGGTISATDLLYALMVFTAALKWSIAQDIYYPRNRLGTPLFLLLTWSSVCLVMGILSGHEVKKSMIEARPLLYLCIFYLTVYFIRDKESFVFALKSFIYAYLVTFAIGFSIFVQGRKTIEYFTMGTVDLGQSLLPRFTLGSQDWVNTLLFLSIGLILFLKDSKTKMYLSLLTALLAFNLLLIQARTQIIAFFVGMIPIIILAPGTKKFKLIAAGLAGVVLLSLVVFSLAQTEVGQKKILDPIAERFSGIYKKKTEVDQSLERRLFEAEAMRSGILARPITGHWFGAKWSNDPKWVWEYKYDVTYIHSSWLFYLYKMGLIGTILMIVILARAFMIALALVRSVGNPLYKGVALGILATIPTYAFTGIFQPTLWQYFMNPILGFELGLLVVMEQLVGRGAAHGNGS